MNNENSLAEFAVDENRSKGRLYCEDYDDSKYRSIFGRDKDRIICSAAFRRLQYKTQVFVNHEGDHYRTRLTHSLEVAQIARWIAGALFANKDLAEIVSLAHDLGHAPFGHAGEEILNLKMIKFGGFSHNAHTLKILTKIETRFIEFEGLNLSWEVLEGIVKHNGPIISASEEYITQYNQKHDLELANYPSLEAQISSLADDIAYNNHDIEDGIRAELFSIEDLFELPLVGEIYKEIANKYPGIRKELIVGEAKKKLTLLMVVDLIEASKQNLKNLNPKSSKDVMTAKKMIIGFSKQMESYHQHLKKFLMERMYRHYKVNRMSASAKTILSSLFDYYTQNPDCMPISMEQMKALRDEKEIAIAVCDYLAGMTDRYAINEFKHLIAIPT